MSWEQVGQLGPAATALAAIVALAIGLATVRQRAGADRRDQWWKRSQWALELSLDDDPARRSIGFAALRVLATSELAGPEEARLLEAAWRRQLDDADERGERMTDAGDGQAGAE